MKTIIRASALMVLLAPMALTVVAEEAAPTDNNAFALSLYGKLAPTEGNLFLSPYSISSAMGMTYAGARENTAA